MFVLDTDHLSALDQETQASAQLLRRLDTEGQEVVTTIISVEEQLRGWLARIAKVRAPRDLVLPYARLHTRLSMFSRWKVLAWTNGAASTFEGLRDGRLKVSTMDLRIASIVMAHDATLLSRNLRDFRRVPGLSVEDWL